MQKESQQERLAEFVASAIEGYKVRKHLTGAEAANRLEQAGALDFLMDGYEMLHTQSLSYVIDEVEAYLQKRRMDI